MIGWHRKGFGLFWTWKIRRGRPAVPADIRSLIRAVCRDNPLWGGPRIYGELRKLGFAIGETSVSKYMVRHRKLREPEPRDRVRRTELVRSPAGAAPRFNRRTWGAWLRSRKSADSIIDTSAASHKGIFGAIPSALECAFARAD